MKHTLIGCINASDKFLQEHWLRLSVSKYNFRSPFEFQMQGFSNWDIMDVDGKNKSVKQLR